MKNIRIKYLIFIILILVQCSTDEEESLVNTIEEEVLEVEDISTTTSEGTSDNLSTETQTSFDHQGMLINWVDNIILPSISNFEEALSDFNEKTSLFRSEPSIESLSSIREFWLNSFLKWQHIEMFDIGVAEEIYFKNRINLYPANVEKIEENISNQDYDLNQSSNFSSQGFNAIAYLLYGIAENDEDIILKYSSENSNYSKYLTDLVDKMIELTTDVKNGWK